MKDQQREEEGRDELGAVGAESNAVNGTEMSGNVGDLALEDLVEEAELELRSVATASRHRLGRLTSAQHHLPLSALAPAQGSRPRSEKREGEGKRESETLRMRGYGRERERGRERAIESGR